MARIIHTECLVYDRKLEELGIPPTDEWAPLSFDLNKVESVRINREEGIAFNNAIVYMDSGESFFINIKHYEFIRIWQQQPWYIRIWNRFRRGRN